MNSLFKYLEQFIELSSNERNQLLNISKFNAFAKNENFITQGVKYAKLAFLKSVTIEDMLENNPSFKANCLANLSEKE